MPGQRRWISSAHSTACFAPANAAKNASPWVSTSWPACPAMAARTSRRCSASTCAYRSRSALTSRVDPSISVNKNVTAPPGSPVTPPPPSPPPLAPAPGDRRSNRLRAGYARQQTEPATGGSLAACRPLPGTRSHDRTSLGRGISQPRPGDRTRPARRPSELRLPLARAFAGAAPGQPRPGRTRTRLSPALPRAGGRPCAQQHGRSGDHSSLLLFVPQPLLKRLKADLLGGGHSGAYDERLPDAG